MARKGLSEGRSCGFLGEGRPDRGNSKCKGPENKLRVSMMPMWPEQREQGSETGGGRQGQTVYIGRASEALAVSEIYSRSVGQPPKGLGQGVT